MSDSPVPAEPALAEVLAKPLAEKVEGMRLRLVVRLCDAFLEDPNTPKTVMVEAVELLRKQMTQLRSTRAQRGAADVLLKHATKVAALAKEDGKAPGATAIVINIQPPPAAGVTVKPESVK